MPVSGRIPLLELVALLAPTLGQEKSHEVVEDIARVLGIVGDPIEPAVAVRLLDAMGKETGMVGVAARFALQRFESRPGASEKADDPDDAPASSGPRRVGVVRHLSVPKRTVERYRLVALLAPTLGQEKAEEVVLGSLRVLGLPEDRLDQRQALSILEQLAAVPGLVGVTARFAKARLILLFSPS